MPRKNPLTGPLGKIKDTALDALKHPRGTAGKVVEQAKGTVAVGRSVAGGVVGEVADRVSSRVPGRHAADAPRAETPHVGSPVRPVQPVPPVPAEPPAKPHGDPMATAPPAKQPSAKDAPATKATPKKPTATKAAAKKAPATKATAKKTAATKAAGKKATTKAAQEASPTPGADEPMPDRPGDRLPPRRETRGGEEEAAPLITPSDTKQVAAEAERGLRDAQGPSES